MAEIMIIRKDDTLTSQELKEALAASPEWATVGLEIRSPQGPRLRSIDPTVLVALVSVTGSVMGNLIAGFLQVVRSKGIERITLELGDGRRIEVQAKNARKELPNLIAMLESAAVKRIII